MAVALVPVARRSRRHRSALRPSPRSWNPQVAVLIVTIAIVNEGAGLRPAASPVRARGAVGLLPPASRTRRPGQGMGRARLAEGPRGGQGPFGHGSGPGSGPGRQGPFRPERSQAPRGPARPSRPSPPPPPLSKEALTGSVPLRTFGQLKQLWEARVDSPEDADPGQPLEPHPEPPTNDQPASSPDPSISAPPPAEAAPGDTGSP